MDRTAVNERPVSYVAQGFALYPHLTVWQQLLFGKGSKPETASYFLERLHLTGLQDRYPDQLSGGQRQRVALAQALCRSPGLLLLDEPFSAVDTPVRQELQRELRRLQKEIGLATVLVTHDPEEAAFLADEVIVISGGSELQSGPTKELYRRPSSPQVARLLGIVNFESSGSRVDGADRCGWPPGRCTHGRTEARHPGAVEHTARANCAPRAWRFTGQRGGCRGRGHFYQSFRLGHADVRASHPHNRTTGFRGRSALPYRATERGHQPVAEGSSMTTTLPQEVRPFDQGLSASSTPTFVAFTTALAIIPG